MSTNGEQGDREQAESALATLVGIALGMLAVKDLLDREELSAIFSLAEAQVPEGKAAASVLDAARAAAENVQSEMIR
jgi:hypothetical protein